MRLERRGERLRFFVDDDLLAEAVDPHPLEAGHVALWTYRNGLLIARVRVAYEEREPVYLPSHLATRRSWPSHPPKKWKSHPIRAVNWRDVPSRFTDFERDVGEVWSPSDAVRLELDSSTAASGASSLKVVNTTSGGDFTLRLNTTPVDVGATPLLCFDYCIPPSVRLNLFLKVKGWRYPVLFLGPENSLTYYVGRMSQHIEPVGRIPAQADGQ